MVVDIDHTIADISWPGLLLFPSRKVRPMPYAPQVLRELSERYDIIFLTRRGDILLEKTRTWLALNATSAALPNQAIQHRYRNRAKRQGNENSGGHSDVFLSIACRSDASGL
jgi:hypothetical protein